VPAARKQAPRVAIEARFSLPFTVAAALCDGAVSLDTFAPSQLVREDFRQLAARAGFERREDWGRAQAACGALRVMLSDGRTLREEVLEPRGSPARPLEDEALLAKFVDCCARARQPLSRGAAEALGGRLLGLDREPSVAALPL
jgi:2-methylcitrate dehydratase PrpD